MKHYVPPTVAESGSKSKHLVKLSPSTSGAMLIRRDQDHKITVLDQVCISVSIRPRIKNFDFLCLISLINLFFTVS